MNRGDKVTMKSGTFADLWVGEVRGPGSVDGFVMVKWDPSYPQYPDGVPEHVTQLKIVDQSTPLGKQG